MNSKELLIAIDRSPVSRIKATVYSIVVSSIRYQDVLTRYSMRFKHSKGLSRREKQVYFPTALRLIDGLVRQGVILGLDVTQYIGVLLDRLEKVKDKTFIAFIDDVLLSKRIVRNTFTNVTFLPESSIKKPSVIHSYGLAPSIAKTIMNIADNIAYYTKIQLEEHKQKLSQVRSRLPLKWSI